LAAILLLPHRHLGSFQAKAGDFPMCMYQQLILKIGLQVCCQ